MSDITRIEKYLSAIESGDKEVPVPITRIEHYLYDIAQNGGGGGGGGFVVSDTAPSNTGVLWIDPSDDTTFPAGTNVGDLLVWNGTEWVAQTPEKPSRLPAGYQEVEYIESTGTQYIDTGYVPKLTTKWELVWRALAGDLIDSSMRNGRHGGGDGERFSISLIFGSGSVEHSEYAIGSIVNSSAKINNKPVVKVKNTTTLDVADNIYCVNGGYDEGTVGGTLTFASQQPLYLMARNSANGADGRGRSRVYSHKIWENGTKVQDFVPCYRKADGVIGMYDLVTDTFFTNAGTGTFTKGADV